MNRIFIEVKKLDRHVIFAEGQVPPIFSIFPFMFPCCFHLYKFIYTLYLLINLLFTIYHLPYTGPIILACKYHPVTTPPPPIPPSSQIIIPSFAVSTVPMSFIPSRELLVAIVTLKPNKDRRSDTTLLRFMAYTMSL